MLFILLMLASKETKKISLNPNGETEVQQPLFFFFLNIVIVQSFYRVEHQEDGEIGAGLFFLKI